MAIRYDNGSFTHPCYSGLRVLGSVTEKIFEKRSRRVWAFGVKMGSEE